MRRESDWLSGVRHALAGAVPEFVKRHRGGVLAPLAAFVVATVLAVSSVLAPSPAAAANDRISKLELKWSADKNDADSLSGNTLSLEPKLRSQFAFEDTNSSSGTVELSFGVNAGSELAAGELEARVPAYIFRNRDGKAQGYFQVGLAGDNAHALAWKFDDAGTADDATDDSIVFYNNVAISDAYNWTVEITYHSTYDAKADGSQEHGIPGDTTDIAGGEGAAGFSNNDIKATLTLGGDAKETKESDPLAVKYRTHVGGNIASFNQNKYFEWQEAWEQSGLAKPADADKYVYITYDISLGYGQDYFNMYERVSQRVTSAKVTKTGAGTVVGWINRSGSAVPPLVSTDAVLSLPDGGNSFYMAVVRYPKADLVTTGHQSYQEQFTFDVAGIDGDAATSSASPYVSWDYTTFSYPAGYFRPLAESVALEGNRGDLTSTNGDGGTSDLSYEGQAAITAIESSGAGADAYSLRYLFGADVVGGNLTKGDGSDGSAPGDYGKKAYKVVSTDDLFAIGNERLQEGDYDLGVLTVMPDYRVRSGDPYSIQYVTAGQYDYVPSKDGNYDWSLRDRKDYSDVTIEYRTSQSGAWSKLGVVSYTGDALSQGSDTPYPVFIPEGSTESASAENIPLPEGTVAVRYSSDTTAGRFAFFLGVTVNLKGTDHNKALVEGLDNATMTDVNSLEVYDHDGNWVNKAGADSIEGGLRDVVTARDEAEFKGNGYSMHDSDTFDLRRVDFEPYAYKKAIATKDDPDNSRTVFSYWASVGESFQRPGFSPTYEQAMRWGLDEQQSGTIYDLLPLGMTVNPSTVRVGRSTHISPDAYLLNDGERIEIPDENLVPAEVSLNPNWRNSGRTMLIVKASVPDDVQNYYGDGLPPVIGSNGYGTHGYSDAAGSGFEMTFDASYSYDAEHDFGSAPTNLIAYQSDSGLKDTDVDTQNNSGKQAFPDNGGGLTGDDAQLMSDLDGDGNPQGTPSNVVYASSQDKLNHIGSTETFTGKLVRAQDDAAYGTSTTVDSGDAYSYELELAGDQAGNSTWNIVMYDKIEAAGEESGNPYWKGTLENVDVSQPTVKGAEPVVYYSTDPDIDVTDQASADRDLKNGKWVETTPDLARVDRSKVTAIAVDLSKRPDGGNFELKGETEALRVIVNMRADVQNPGELEAAGATAVNDSAIESIKMQDSGKAETDFYQSHATTVKIHDVTPPVTPETPTTPDTPATPNTPEPPATTGPATGAPTTGPATTGPATEPGTGAPTTAPATSPETGGPAKQLPQTGDSTPAAWAFLALAGVAAALVALGVRARGRRE